MNAGQTIDMNDAAADGGRLSPSWADLFFNILTKPIATIHQLDQLCETASLFKLTQQAFNTVFLTAMVASLVRIYPGEIFISLLEVLAVVTNEMVFWVLAAAMLTMLSAALPNARRVRWKKALVLTGWSLAPVIFFAPMACFKTAFGAWAALLATLPTWWTVALLLLSYKISLGITSKKLLVLAVLVPPIVFLAYIFWTGFSLWMILSELLSSFQR